MSRPWVDLDDETGQIVINRPRWVARRLYRWADKVAQRRDAETARLRALGLPQKTYDLTEYVWPFPEPAAEEWDDALDSALNVLRPPYDRGPGWRRDRGPGWRRPPKETK